MEKEDIHLWDVERILLGEAPVLFMAEVFVRTILIYLVLLVTIRLMGKRMSGQLTIAEMSVMLMLGAIVSPAMQIPNLGLLQGALILVMTLIFQRGLNLLEFKNHKLERLNHGKATMVVKNGKLVLEELSNAKLSRQQLFAVLRNASIFNLGEVERVYLESFGMFSIYKYENAKPGLSMLPAADNLSKEMQMKDLTHGCACTSCGHVEEEKQTSACPVCSAEAWTEATISI